MILFEKGKGWTVYGDKKRSFGTYLKRPQAEDRLRQIEMFEHMKQPKPGTKK